MNNCVICLETIETDSYDLKPCLHEFHADCIMNWFRNWNSQCPCCRNDGIQEPEQRPGNLAYASRQARKKSASPEAKRLYAKYQQSKTRYAKIKAEITDFRKTNTFYFSLRTQLLRLRRRNRSARRGLRGAKRAMIAAFPVEEN
jgi:hypothetical protein